MRRLLTTLAAFTAITTAASAADLPRRAAPPVFTPIPVFTWTGFYAGFNAGYGFGVDDTSPTILAFSDTSTVGGASVFNLPNVPIGPNGTPPGFPVGGVAAVGGRGSTDGFTGGAQIGYNYQFTPGSGVVVGVEADAQYVDFGRNRNNTLSGVCQPTGTASCFTTFFGLPTDTNIGAAGFGVGTTSPNVVIVNPNGVGSLDFYGTVRGRLGYAFDRVLFYGTGGFAYGSGEQAFRGPGNGGGRFRTGYAVGGGIEYALPTDSFFNFFRASAVTLKVEGLYVNLDQGRGNGIVAYNTANGAALFANDPDVQVIGRRSSADFAVVRAGINYKFGSY